MADRRLRGQMSDQASRLRELVRRRRSTAVTIAVVSGKGGVGKSNIAVNLSICLALRGQRVALVDVDMGLANADLLLNVTPTYTLADVLSGARSVAEVVIEAPGGVQFVGGASGLHELADLSEFERQRLARQLMDLETNTDIIVLDCGAGIGGTVLGFAMCADRVVVVTTPQPTALTDAYAMVKALDREKCEADVSIFVNMASSRAVAHRAYQRIAGVAKRFLNYSVAESGYMLQDRAVELAVQHRCPFVIRSPGSNATACISAMANEISRAVPGVQRFGGFFSRVAGLFV